jgi:hypothetical protein
MSLAYLTEQRTGQIALLDGMVLSRMNRIREMLVKRSEGIGLPISDLVVLVGPSFDRGVRVDVISLERARAVDSFPDTAKPAPPGQISVFCWNHHGFSALRTFAQGQRLDRD